MIWRRLVCDLLRIAMFRLLYFPFISFSLAFSISNIRYLVNIVTLAVFKFLFPFNRLLSDNQISSIGTRVFSISNKKLFM